MKILVGVMGLLWAGVAHADGVFPSAALAKSKPLWAQKIAEVRAQDPEVFALVAALDGFRPERYRRSRVQRPDRFGLDVRRLGTRATWALLEVAVFRAPERGRATDAEWAAFKTGLLDGLAMSKEAALAPLYRHVLSTDQPTSVWSAAAVGLGRLGEAELAGIERFATVGDRRFSAVARGLGASRRIRGVNSLARLLDEVKSESDAQVLAEALGDAASSWAWATGSVGSAQDGEVVQRAAREALTRNHKRFRGTGRTAIDAALQMSQ